MPDREASPGHLLLVTSSRFGDGPEELGRTLMRSYLKVQIEEETKPWRVIFLNSGIELTTDGSPVLEDLRALAAAGTEILSCGTCLDFYQRKEALQVGRVSNMREISESLRRASSLIRL